MLGEVICISPYPPHPPPPVPILSTFGISLPLPRGMESYILDLKKIITFLVPKLLTTNTAVKHWACAKIGTFFDSCTAIFCARVYRKTWETTGFTHNLRNKMEMFVAICKRKRRLVNGKLKSFQTQRLLNYRYCVDLPFSF